MPGFDTGAAPLIPLGQGTHPNRSLNMLPPAGQCQTIHTTTKLRFKSASKVQQTMSLMCAGIRGQSDFIYKTQMDSLSILLGYITGFAHGLGHYHPVDAPDSSFPSGPFPRHHLIPNLLSPPSSSAGGGKCDVCDVWHKI